MSRTTIGLAVLMLTAAAAPGAWAQATATTSTGSQARVIPLYPELGAPAFVAPSGSLADDPVGSGTAAASGGTDTTAAGASTGGTDALATMMAQSYGGAAAEAAQSAGITQASLASFGQVESGFRNVAAANGSTSALGVWQITQATWNGTVANDSLPYTAADRNDPAAQAVVASYVIRDTATSMEQLIGSSPTVLQTYGGYVFGPTNGARLATADEATPMSAVLPAEMLANNNMQGWSVGRFRQTMTQRLGSGASAPVLAAAT